MSERPTILSNAEKPWTLNDERSGHWSVHRKRTAEWREAWGWLGRVHRRVIPTPCIVTVQVTQAKGTLADAGAHFPAAKAAIDGLVDAHVLPGDSPEHVRAVYMLAPTRGEVDAMTLRFDRA